MTSSKASNDLEERLLQFGIAVIRFVNSEKAHLPFSVIDQVIRSATSVGANYSEAQNASSRQDFRNKVFIAKKEASETRYWLRLISELIPSDNVQPILKESQEIIYILQSIATSLASKGSAK